LAEERERERQSHVGGTTENRDRGELRAAVMSAVSGEQRERASSGKEWKNENQWRKKEMEEEEGVDGAEE
jgi:hypothetical protein